MRIHLLDYGGGNIKSVARAIAACGYTPEIVSDANTAQKADVLVVPGQGAVGAAMDMLVKKGLDNVIRAHIEKKPYLGICLGFQLLYDFSEEDGGHNCLGILPGRVQKIPDIPTIKVPQMGWNQLELKKDPRGLFSGLTPPIHAYFANSYVVMPETDVYTATETTHGISFTSSIQTDTIVACQFHPEKSGQTGLTVLKRFFDSLRSPACQNNL